MTGLDELNYPAFNKMAAYLRSQGHRVENPASNPAPPCGTWEAYMRMALAQMLTCDTVVMLPGWSKSRGAAIEYRLAIDLGLRILFPKDVGA